jgi:transcriptional regulator with XRE-family HTH domain
MDTWAEKIATLESRGWSLSGIGRSIGLSPQALSDIKQGRSTSPRGMAAVRLHNLFSTGEKPVAEPS